MDCLQVSEVQVSFLYSLKSCGKNLFNQALQADESFIENELKFDVFSPVVLPIAFMTMYYWIVCAKF